MNVYTFVYAYDECIRVSRLRSFTEFYLFFSVFFLSFFCQDAYVIYIRNMYVENTLNSVRRIKKECTWYIDRVFNSALPRAKIMTALTRRIDRSTYY